MKLDWGTGLISFLAIDGALNNFGLAEGVIKRGKIYITDIHTVSPRRNSKKNITMQDANRIRIINREIKKRLRGKQIVFSEIAYGSQSASGAWSLGVALGIIASIDKPIVFVTPLQAKAITGNKKANKKDMILWATGVYPNLDWKYARNGRLLIGDTPNGHMADAIAISYAGYKKYRHTGYDLSQL